MSSKPASTIQRLSHWKAKLTFPLEVFQLLQILAKSEMAGLCHFSHSDKQACCYALVLICASLLTGDVDSSLRCLSAIFGASSVSVYIGDHVLFCLSLLLSFLFFFSVLIWEFSMQMLSGIWFKYSSQCLSCLLITLTSWSAEVWNFEVQIISLSFNGF